MVAEFALSRLDAFDDDSKKRVVVNIYQPRSHVIQIELISLLLPVNNILFVCFYQQIDCGQIENVSDES